jgi:prolyl-tRNA synthetase
MRMSHLFGSTLRQVPAGVGASRASGVRVASHRLLLRAGFVRQLGQGLYSYLPPARRAMHKIEAILRQEMDAIGGQELTMPVVHPAETWKASGRWWSIGPELARFSDRRDRDLVLAMTHEEVVAELCRTEIGSWRQLPQLVYQIQTKFRDDPRPRAGLLRVREFTMKDSYSLDRDEAGLDRQYRAHYQAYFNIFNRCALPTVAVGADVGMMGGSLSHEFMYLTPAGEDTLVLCAVCGYAANRQVARFAKPAAVPEAPLPVEKVATPGVATIEALAGFLGVPASRTAKAVFLAAERQEPDGPRGELVLAVVRGDMEVNETKLANAVGATALRPATEEEILAAGAVPGYASPVGLEEATVVADDAVAASPNLVAGANQAGYHLRNVNLGRDFAAAVVTDLAVGGDGDACVGCGAELATARGVEVGNIFKLGTSYSEAAGATYLDPEGVQRPVVMGSYGIGVGRLLACIAEEHHDERGLRWPVTVAPWQVHLVALGGSGPDARAAADRVEQALAGAGVEVLHDDRGERPGVQFADADLIGLPLRLTASDRSLAKGGVEVKRRDADTPVIVDEGEVVAHVRAELQALAGAVAARVVTVELGDAGS